jgi:hypothetical protein
MFAGRAPFIAAIAACLAAPCSAFAATFSDATFDLDSYTTTVFQSGGATIEMLQAADSGNPGAHLAISTDTPATGGSTFHSFEYFLGKTFLYDPSVNGAIRSISWAVDVSFQALSSGFTLRALSGGILLSQGGEFYTTFSSLPIQQGIFQTASGLALTESAFNRVIDLTTGATDPSLHPNFASGEIQFGTLAGVFIEPFSAAHSILIRVDNLSIDVTPVPEPSQLAMVGVGALLLAFRWRLDRRRAGGGSPRTHFFSG